MGRVCCLLSGMRECERYDGPVSADITSSSVVLILCSIICRAFQGIGASGLYSLTQIGLVEVGPSHRPSVIGALIGSTLAFAFIIGPLVGGAVAHLSDWRWLFNMKCEKPYWILSNDGG